MRLTNSRTKQYVVPLSQGLEGNKVHSKYIGRPNTMNEMSFLQWLRHVDHNKQNPAPYKTGTTLVSVQMISPFKDEYFFQFTLMNFPHREYTSLYHERHEDLPTQIRFFAAAVTQMPHFWGNEEAVIAYFQADGNKQYYVDTLKSHIASLHDTFCLWQREVITSNQLFGNVSGDEETYPLDNFQNAIFQQIMTAMLKRDSHHDNSEVLRNV